MDTPNKAEIANKVRAVFIDRFGDAAKKVDADADLPDVLPGLDSLQSVQVVSAIEDLFGFEVDYVGDDVRYWFATINRIVDYVSDRLEDQVE